MRSLLIESIFFLEEYDKTGKYCEFGQINLLVIETKPTMTFLIIDGQVNLLNQDV